MSKIKIDPEKFIDAGERVTAATSGIELKQYEWNVLGELETLNKYLENFNRFTILLGKYTEWVKTDMERNKQAVLAMLEVDENLISKKE